MEQIISIIVSFLLTCIIEFIALIIIKERDKKILNYSVIVNLITNIPLNLFILNFSFKNIVQYFIIVISLEIVIIIIEWLLYYLLLKNIKKSLKYAIILNITSYIMGLIISIIL